MNKLIGCLIFLGILTLPLPFFPNRTQAGDAAPIKSVTLIQVIGVNSGTIFVYSDGKREFIKGSYPIADENGKYSGQLHLFWLDLVELNSSSKCVK